MEEVKKWPDGQVYEGEFKEGLKHGKGSCIFSNKQKYNGYFVMGKYEGKGEFIWEDGMKYVGDFKDNKINGEGEWIWPNGDVYKGNFVEGKCEGYGVERKKMEKYMKVISKMIYMKERVLKHILMEKNMKEISMKAISKGMVRGFMLTKVNQKEFGKKVKKMERQKKLCPMGMHMKLHIKMGKKLMLNLWQNNKYCKNYK